MGPADKISINLTDTDDLDNSYLIDQNGMIDLPFIGKIKLDGLNLSEAQNILTNVVKNYYKNPDLQINIDEFNKEDKYLVFSGIGNHKTFISMLNNNGIKIIKDININFF